MSAMNLCVELATEHDITAWLDLAREVGELFGADMARDPAFSRTLQRSIARSTALCVRIDDGLAGAMLFRAGSIDWLAVLKRHRRRGVARALVAYAQTVHGEVRVTTFGPGHPHEDSQASRALYRAMGFAAVEDLAEPAGPDGTPREALVWRVATSDQPVRRSPL
jgi:ribosomal protein S18 acetylase RimI-like enzyme